VLFTGFIRGLYCPFDNRGVCCELGNVTLAFLTFSLSATTEIERLCNTIARSPVVLWAWAAVRAPLGPALCIRVITSMALVACLWRNRERLLHDSSCNGGRTCPPTLSGHSTDLCPGLPQPKQAVPAGLSLDLRLLGWWSPLRKTQYFLSFLDPKAPPPGAAHLPVFHVPGSFPNSLFGITGCSIVS